MRFSFAYRFFFTRNQNGLVFNFMNIDLMIYHQSVMFGCMVGDLVNLINELPLTKLSTGFISIFVTS